MNAIQYTVDKETSQVQVIDESEEDTEKASIVLYQNKPNPFDGSTIIEFTLPWDGPVQFNFYNLAGELLHQQQSTYEKGTHKIQVDEDQLNNVRGLIYYQISSGGQTITRSMVVGID